MFREFGDSSLVFELWAYVAHPFSELRAIDQINRLVYDEFDDADIVIPFPRREISFLDSEQDVLHNGLWNEHTMRRQNRSQMSQAIK